MTDEAVAEVDRTWSWQKRLVAFWAPVIGLSLTLWGASSRAVSWAMERQSKSESAVQYQALQAKVESLEDRLRDEMERNKATSKAESSEQLNILREDLRQVSQRIDAVYRAVRTRE